MEIIILDMGHGNCIEIFDKEKSSSMLIDCGSERSKINNFTNLIKYRVKNVKNRDLAVTHYHFDHYNLLDILPRKFFDNIYLPCLPPLSHTARAMLKFLALAITSQYQEYYLIPTILTKAKNICPLIKKDSFSAICRDWEVLWPDYNILDRSNRRKIETILSKINTIKKN